MFEFITENEERGQVGIGTLIVFIAMVLVAAIAAGVLINSAGFLQTQAEATGEDSTALVSERINVNSEVGIVNSSDTSVLEEIRIAVMGAPGANQIDLAESTLQVVGPGGQQNLVFTDGTLTALEIGPVDNSTVGSDGEFDVTIGNIDRFDAIDTTANEQQLVVTVNETAGGTTTRDTATITNTSVVNDGAQTINVSSGTPDSDKLNLSTKGLEADDEITVELYNNSTSTNAQYLVATVTIVADNSQSDSADATFASTVSDLNANEFAVGSANNFESSPVLSQDNDYTILINPDAGAFSDGSAFGEGQEATIDIVSPAGATTRVELRSPDLFGSGGEAVLL